MFHVEHFSKIETESKQFANRIETVCKTKQQEERTVAKFELNIYGDNDEVLKKYATDHLRYGVLMQALELQEGMEGMTMAEQLETANALVKKVFCGLTDEELACADAGDVLATFAQVTKHAEKIGKTPSGKN